MPQIARAASVRGSGGRSPVTRDPPELAGLIIFLLHHVFDRLCGLSTVSRKMPDVFPFAQISERARPKIALSPTDPYQASATESACTPACLGEHHEQ
jgi:hypothetical protein